MPREYTTKLEKMRVTIRECLPGDFYNVSKKGRAEYFNSVPAGNPLRKFYPGESVIMAIPDGNLKKKYLEGDPIINYYVKRLPDTLVVNSAYNDYPMKRYNFEGEILNTYEYLRIFRKDTLTEEYTELDISGSITLFTADTDEIYLYSDVPYSNFHWGNDDLGSANCTYYLWDGEE